MATWPRPRCAEHSRVCGERIEFDLRALGDVVALQGCGLCGGVRDAERREVFEAELLADHCTAHKEHRRKPVSVEATVPAEPTRVLTWRAGKKPSRPQGGVRVTHVHAHTRTQARTHLRGGTGAWGCPRASAAYRAPTTSPPLSVRVRVRGTVRLGPVWPDDRIKLCVHLPLYVGEVDQEVDQDLLEQTQPVTKTGGAITLRE